MARYKKKGKVKTKEEKEEISKYKDFISKHLSKSYRDMSPIALNKCSLGLKKLRYGAIDSHKLISVQIGLDIIELHKSWTEFILIMLSDIISNNSDNFTDILLKKQITNTNFTVDKIYGNYSFDVNQQYTVYKIFDTGYYLEFINKPEIIFNSMINMIYALEIQPESILFKLESKQNTIDNIDTIQLTDELTVNIEDSIPYLDKNIFIVKSSILNEEINTHSIEAILVAYCNKVFDKYGLDKMLNLDNTEGTGICINNLLTNYPCVRIKNSLALVYTDSNAEYIIEFIVKSMEKLGIDKKEFTITFRNKSSIKHEWEID